jgi:outer membrane autotransporter protein
MTAWTNVFGAWGNLDADGNAAEAKRSLGGFVTGLDGRVGNWRFGAAAGHTRSDVNVAARMSTADVESFHLAGYAVGTFGPLSLRGGGAIAWHDFDTRRTAAFPGFIDNLRAQYGGHTAQVFGEVGYALALGRFAVEPFAGLAAVWVNTDPFAETGGAAALAGARERHDVVYSTLGVRAATVIPLSAGTALIPRVTLAWQHAFDDLTPPTAMRFLATGAPFTVAGLPIAQDSALVEAGLDVAIGRDLTFGVSYVGQLSADGHDHAVKGKATLRF